jgi:hypothetical protein
MQYPDWRPSDHPDLTHWMGSEWQGSESPWTVEQLLSRDPFEQLDDLLNFQGRRIDGPSRDGLLANVREAGKQKDSWAISLAQALAQRALWPSDLWPALIRGLQDSDLGMEGWRQLLTLASNLKLQSVHPYDIANLLYALVRDGGKPFALDLLEQANAIALPVWKALEANAQEEGTVHWLSRAINQPAGVIVNFWLDGLLLLMRGKTGAERFMPEDYRDWLTLVVQDETSKGGMGRSLLASRNEFLFRLDERWTRKYIIPLFSDSDPQRFAQAWEGFLMCKRLNSALVEVLMPAFLDAVSRCATDLHNCRQRFIEFYTTLCVFYVSDPTEKLLPVLFQNGSLEDRLTFASQIGCFLSQMKQEAKQQLWNGWLRRYWHDRHQGVPAALDEAEIQKMVEWLPHLGDAFPEAVALAVRFPVIKIKHVIYKLSKSDLVMRFPHSTAELLIYLAKCVDGYRAADLAEINTRLPPIPVELRRKVDEALVRAGVPMLQE